MCFHTSQTKKVKELEKRYKVHLSVPDARDTYDNTLELLSYLASKNYKIDWFEIRFKNGWAIKNHWLNGIEFITNNTMERNLLIEKLITISGQGPIDINSLQINEIYTLCTNGKVKHKPLFD